MFFDNRCRLAEELLLLEEVAISIDALFGTPDFIDTFRRIASIQVLSFDGDSSQAEKTRKKGDEVDEDFLNEELSEPKSDDEINEDVLNAEISDDMFANLKHVSLNGINYQVLLKWHMLYEISTIRSRIA